jgi:heptosyltransferase-2
MGSPAILVIGPSWIGDMVMAQSLFITLKRRHPGVMIDVVAPAWSVPVIARMPEVRDAIVSPTEHGELALGKRRRLGRSLRDKRYQQAIVLPRSFKSALVPWFANVPLRTGYRGEMRFGLLNDMRELDKSVLDQTVKRFVALGLDDGAPPVEIPHPLLRSSAEQRALALESLGLDAEQPVVALMPGAEYGPAKCWPLAHFADLAARLDDAGFATWVLGSAKDTVAGAWIAGKSPATNLCGQTSLEQAVDLLAHCRHAVSNDSGLMHVAAATGIPVVAIYGSTSPGYTPPLTDKASVQYLGIDCSPCFERECPLGHLKCLTGIHPEAVLSAIMAAE